LLTAACDEFIFYDDLVQEEATKKQSAKPSEQEAKAKTADRKPEQDKQQQAIELVLETLLALQAERGEEERILGSLVKQALRRRKPGFKEAPYGFRSFSGLLEEAQRRGLVRLERDERSGGYIVHPRGE